MKFTVINSAKVTPHNDNEWQNEIPKAMKRRAPRIWRMAHVAVSRALSELDIKPKSIITSTALGALDETVGFLNGSFTDGFGSPRNFIASVHNSMAGNLAMSFDIKGPNLTVCDSQNSLASSLVSASFLNESDFPVLLIAVDERTELLDNLYENFSPDCKDVIDPNWVEGAVAFLIDRSDSNELEISADGPTPLNNLLVEDFFKSIQFKFSSEGLKFHNYKDSSKSFITTALILHEIINDSTENKSVVPAFSPSSNAVSFIKIERKGCDTV